MAFRDRCIVVNKLAWKRDRMLRRITLCAAVVLVSTSVAGSSVAKADGLDPIAVRQAVMSLQGGDFAYIREVLAAKGDVKPLEVPAKAIIKSTSVIPTLFPKGTESGGDTRALPEVWSDPAGFRKIAAAATDAATKLAAAAKAGDADEVAADTRLLGEQCGACHKAYRAK
jgi:cytochrome c556